MPWRTISAQFGLVLTLAWLFWGADIWTAISSYTLPYLLAGGVFAALLSLPWIFKRHAGILVAPCLWGAFVIVLPQIDNSALKPMMRGVDDLEPGMNRETVLATINGRFQGTRFPPPRIFSEEEVQGVRKRQSEPAGTLTRLCLKPQGRDPGFGAECLLVFFVEGRFTGASFSAD